MAEGLSADDRYPGSLGSAALLRAWRTFRLDPPAGVRRRATVNEERTPAAVLSIVVDKGRSELGADLDELVGEDARRMLAVALEEEVAVYIAAHARAVDAHDQRLVCRNSHTHKHTVRTAAGPVPTAAPRVDEAAGGPSERDQGVASECDPATVMARDPEISPRSRPCCTCIGRPRDFAPALESFFRATAGLSASVITRLTAQWQTDREAFGSAAWQIVTTSMCGVDGCNHFNVRLAKERPRIQVIIGVRTEGAKELIAVANGLHESTKSWAELLYDLRRRRCGHGACRWRRCPWTVGGVAGRVPRPRPVLPTDAWITGPQIDLNVIIIPSPFGASIRADA